MNAIDIFNLCAVVACGVLFFPSAIWAYDEKKNKEGRVNIPALIMWGVILLVPIVDFIDLIISL